MWPVKVLSGLLSLPHNLIVLSRLHVLRQSATWDSKEETMNEGTVQRRRVLKEDMVVLRSWFVGYISCRLVKTNMRDQHASYGDVGHKKQLKTHSETYRIATRERLQPSVQRLSCSGPRSMALLKRGEPSGTSNFLSTENNRIRPAQNGWHKSREMKNAGNHMYNMWSSLDRT